MLLTYGALNSDELTSAKLVDVLVRVYADLDVFEDDDLLSSEPAFLSWSCR